MRAPARQRAGDADDTTMTSQPMPMTEAERRAAVRRTAWIVAGVAVLVLVSFVASVVMMR
jgi:hypothetical protein